ncbi:MAG: tetratricopeptide repeat protein [Armatimonadota bacterium]
MKTKVLILILLLGFLAVSVPMANPYEQLQISLLQKISSAPMNQWKDIIDKSNTVNQDFITMCKQGAEYSIIRKNDLEEAYRYCYLADLSAKKINLKDNYRLGFANYCYNTKNYDLSIKICTQLLDEKYNDPRVLVIMGMDYKEKKDFKSAVKYLTEADKLDPQNYNVHYNLGLIYLELGEKEKAKEAFDKAIELKPEKKEEIEKTTNLTAKTDEDFNALLKKAKKFISENKTTEALECLKQCITLDSKNYEVYLLLGKISVQNGNYSLGITYLERSLELCESDPQTYYYLGYAYEHMYDSDKKDPDQLLNAQKNYLKSFNLDPKYDFAKKDVTRVEEKIEKYKADHEKKEEPAKQEKQEP